MNPRPKPPVKCTPCHVTLDGQRYRILSDGRVAALSSPLPLPTDLGLKTVKEVLQWEVENLTWHAPHSDLARKVRREASRLRHNRNARERNQAMRDLGMKKTPYGWE
jgi:hypothetical protein